jgi:hypothetical protein
MLRALANGRGSLRSQELFLQHPLNPASERGAASAIVKETLLTRVIVEARKLVVITLYLWFLLALFSVYKRMLLQQHGISVWNQGFAIVNALIFAKVIVIGQALDIGKQLRDQALVWVVLGKSLIFAILLILFHVSEESIRAWANGLPVASSIDDYGGGSALGLATYVAIFFVALTPFFAFQEVSRALGGGDLWDFFFASGKKRFKLVAEE